jgi:hypothetical protein
MEFIPNEELLEVVDKNKLNIYSTDYFENVKAKVKPETYIKIEKDFSDSNEYKLLKPVYGLSLLGENFDQGPDFYHHYKIVNIDKPERILEGLQFVFIELPKFPAFASTHPSLRKLQVLWLRFMSEVNENTEAIDPELLQVPEIAEAVSLSEEAAYSKTELVAYEAYWDSVSTEKTLFAGRYEEGIIQGESNMLLKLLLTKFKEVPAPYRDKIRYAKQADLEAWCLRFVTADSMEAIFTSSD